MAIFHWTTQPVKRSSGRSAPGAAAYVCAARLVDSRTGITLDYRKKRGVVFAATLTPDGAPIDRQKLWDMAEAAESRKDGRTARAYEFSLPAELEAQERRRLALEFGRELMRRHGVAIDLAIHEPPAHGDRRNHHCHIIATTRRYAGGRLEDKASIEWSDKKRREAGLEAARDEIESLRGIWEEMANAALARARRPERISAASLKAQGADRTPTIHLGPICAHKERRGIFTWRGSHNRLIATLEKRCRERQIMEAEMRRMARLIEAEEERERQENELLAARDREDAGRIEADERAAREAAQRDNGGNERNQAGNRRVISNDSGHNGRDGRKHGEIGVKQSNIRDIRKDYSLRARCFRNMVKDIKNDFSKFQYYVKLLKNQYQRTRALVIEHETMEQSDVQRLG